MSIDCPHHTPVNDTLGTCKIVADVSGLPVADCLLHEDTCHGCLTCGWPPEKPNAFVAQSAIELVREYAPNRLPLLEAELQKHLSYYPGGDVATPANFPCVHRGKSLGETESDLSGITANKFELFECSQLGPCSIGYRHSKVTNICTSCKLRREPTRPDQRIVVVNSEVHGFGDAVTMAWASEGSKHAPVKLIHFARGAKKEFLEMLGQEVTEEDAGSMTTFEAYCNWELDLERGSVPRVWSRSRALGIKTAPMRPTVRIPQESLDWADGIIAGSTKAPDGKLIVMFPQTVYRSREWPSPYWHDLAWQLMLQGHAVKMCLHPKEKRWDRLVCGYLHDFPWSHWAALMARADLTVAVSSGPASLAATMDVPTLVLEGPTKSTIWANTPSVEVMRVGKAVLDCDGCHFGRPFRRSCDLGCQSLMRLYPEVVLKRILEKLDEPRDRKFSDWEAVLAGLEGVERGVSGGLLSSEGAGQAAAV